MVKADQIKRSLGRSGVFAIVLSVPLTEQLELPLTGAVAQADWSAVWLFSASGDDAKFLRRACTSNLLRKPNSIAIFEVETGRAPVGPSDILFVKTAEQSSLDVYVPEVLVRNKQLETALDESLQVVPPPPGCRAILDLGILRFGGGPPRHLRKGWRRTRLESTLDALMCREILGNAALKARLCGELLSGPELDPQSPLKPLLLSMRADALLAEKREGAHIAAPLYRASSDLFRQHGAVSQSRRAARFAKELSSDSAAQLSFFPDALTYGGEQRHPRFHIARFSGLRIAVRPPDPLARSYVTSSLRRYALLGSKAVEARTLLAWLTESQSLARMLTVSAVESSENRSEFCADFVFDTEMATRLGVSGYTQSCLPVTLIPTSVSCRISPPAIETVLGRPARFRISTSSMRRHRIEVVVLTADSSPSSIEFTFSRPVGGRFTAQSLR